MEKSEGENSQKFETPQNPSDSQEDRTEILKALEIVERDSIAIAESYASLFSSLRLALSEVTNTSVENMQCFSDLVGSIQESALDAATKGNRYINSCLRLSEELKGMETLALQLLYDRSRAGKIGEMLHMPSLLLDCEEECGCSGFVCEPVTSASLSPTYLKVVEVTKSPIPLSTERSFLNQKMSRMLWQMG